MSYYPGGPAPNQSSYPGGPQSSYPGGPGYQQPSYNNGGSQSSYPGDPLSSQSGPSSYSSYPGGAQQSSYGAQSSPYPNSNTQGYQQHNSYNNNNDANSYGGPPSNPSYGNSSGYPQQQGPMQYDQNGNPLPEGERGLGTMAAGAAAGWAGNKMTGGHMGTFGSMAGGAILAQVVKRCLRNSRITSITMGTTADSTAVETLTAEDITTITTTSVVGSADSSNRECFGSM